MVALTKSQYRLLTIASLLGIFQGLTWIIMSMICIIYHLDENLMPDFSQTPSSFMQLYQLNLYHVYLHPINDNSSQTLVNQVTPDTFSIFMWIYLFSNIIWTILSILLLRLINRVIISITNILRCWGVITCFISVIDFILVILLGVDFDDCMSRSRYIEEEANCTTLIIPVMTIAARGFVLWIINVIFVYVVYRIIRTMQAGKNLERKLLTTDRQIPRPTLPGSSPNLYGQSQTPTLYDQSQGSSYITPSNSSNYLWSNTPGRPVSYESRSGPSSPYYVVPPEQPTFRRY